MISLPSAWPGPEIQRRLAAGASLLLAIALAWLVARIFWVLVTPDDAPAVIAQPRPSPSADSSPMVDLGRYHLFGEFEEHPTVAAYHDAPETSLNLELRGIVSSADPASGFAIIVAGGRQAAYDVGEEVPGGAEVRRHPARETGQFPDRVVGGALVESHLFFSRADQHAAIVARHQIPRPLVDDVLKRGLGAAKQDHLSTDRHDASGDVELLQQRERPRPGGQAEIRGIDPTRAGQGSVHSPLAVFKPGHLDMT